MTKNKWKISGMIIGSVFIILLLLFVFWGKQDVNLENTGIEEVPQGQDQSVSSGVTIEGAKDKVREPGIYRRGPLRFINGEYVRIEGEFVPWKALEKQGVVIVKQGELSTPETGEEEEPEDYESVRNIDGIVPPIVNEETADGYEGNRDIFRPDFMD